MDIDDDGKLTEAEFIVQALINQYNVEEEKLLILKDFFNILDRDGSGNITIEDFEQWKNLPQNVSAVVE